MTDFVSFQLPIVFANTNQMTWSVNLPQLKFQPKRLNVDFNVVSNTYVGDSKLLILESDLLPSPLAHCILGQRQNSNVDIDVEAKISLSNNIRFRVLQISSAGTTSVYASEGAMGVYITLTFYKN